MTTTLMGAVDRELPEQRDRHRIGLVALMCLGKKCALDLRRAQGHVADDPPAGWIAHDAGARNASRVVVPGMAKKPSIQGIPTAIEAAAVVRFGERAGRGYFRHVGGRFASSFRPATSRAGFRAQASKRSQSLAGILTTRRSATSISAASSALRPTKELRLVCACKV